MTPKELMKSLSRTQVDDFISDSSASCDQERGGQPRKAAKESGQGIPASGARTQLSQRPGTRQPR